MRKIVVLAACLLVSVSGGAAPVASVPASNPPAPSAPISNDAMRLSRLVNPEDKMLAAGLKGFEFGIAAELKRNPGQAAEFERSPGLLEAIKAAGLPVMRSHLIAAIPGQ